jgi:hypothetical protein
MEVISLVVFPIGWGAGRYGEESAKVSGTSKIFVKNQIDGSTTGLQTNRYANRANRVSPAAFTKP